MVTKVPHNDNLETELVEKYPMLRTCYVAHLPEAPF